jgi:hypothetical protein
MHSPRPAAEPAPLGEWLFWRPLACSDPFADIFEPEGHLAFFTTEARLPRLTPIQEKSWRLDFQTEAWASCAIWFSGSCSVRINDSSDRTEITLDSRTR